MIGAVWAMGAAFVIASVWCVLGTWGSKGR
jgi:hypothetical protein